MREWGEEREQRQGEIDQPGRGPTGHGYATVIPACRKLTGRLGGEGQPRQDLSQNKIKI